MQGKGRRSEIEKCLEVGENTLLTDERKKRFISEHFAIETCVCVCVCMHKFKIYFQFLKN